MATYKTSNVNETGDTDFKPPIGGMAFARYAKFTVDTALALNDVIEMVPVYKDETVLAVLVKSGDLDTGATPTISLDVGDGDDVDFYIDGSNIGQAGGQANGVIAKKYTADDTIDIKCVTAPATGATAKDIEMWVVIA